MYKRISFTMLPLISLMGCVSTSNDAPKQLDVLNPSQATVLFTVGEGWAFQSGQAFVVLTGNGDKNILRSMTDRNGGAGSADLVEESRRAYEYNAISVSPGSYTLRNWGFSMRAGTSVPRQINSVSLEAGKVYYLGSLYANNLTQTSRISNQWMKEQAAYQKKFPKLAGVNIQNSSESFSVTCWKMDVTDTIAKDNPVIADLIKGC